MTMFLIFSAVLVLMFIGVTTAVTMGFASIATFLFAGGDISRLFLVPQRMFAQVSGITLMSIPFFLLMGNLMSVGGISKSLFGFGRVCLGHRWGGLSNAAIAASIVMAAMSGSAAACAAGIGMIAISEMTRAGYSRSFSCATIAAGGALGPIIPPSITLILYAGLTQTSVNALFEAGAVPGLLLGFAFMAWSSFVSYKNNYAKEAPSPYSARWQAFKDAFFALLTPVIVIGGMFAGFFTATEAAAIASLYVMLLGFFVTKTLKVKDLPRIFWETVEQTAKVMFVIATAGFFQFVLSLHAHSAGNHCVYHDEFQLRYARAPSHHRAPGADGVLHGGHRHSADFGADFRAACQKLRLRRHSAGYCDVYFACGRRFDAARGAQSLCHGVHHGGKGA